MILDTAYALQNLVTEYSYEQLLTSQQVQLAKHQLENLKKEFAKIPENDSIEYRTVIFTIQNIERKVFGLEGIIERFGENNAYVPFAKRQRACTIESHLMPNNFDINSYKQLSEDTYSLLCELTSAQQFLPTNVINFTKRFEQLRQRFNALPKKDIDSEIAEQVESIEYWLHNVNENIKSLHSC